MSRIAIIPARGGSRRIPGKNIRAFHGKPIIAYSIETAIASALFDAVVVSADSQEIADVATRYGAQHLTRSDYHAQDEVGTQEVMRHALRMYGALHNRQFDQACCIYPCAPMLTAQDLRAAAHWVDNGRSYAFTVGTEPLVDAGMFYFGWTKHFLSRMPLATPHSAMIPIPPARCCDINTEDDWQRAERMYAALDGNPE